MRQLVIVSFTITALLTTVNASVRAQTPAPAPQAPAPGAQMPAPATPDAAREEWSSTQHSMRIGGRTVNYVAKAGTTTIRNEEGEITGLMYCVSYTHAEGCQAAARVRSRFSSMADPGRRRCGCTWGPSGPSAWSPPTANTRRPAPYPVVDNSETLLDRTDLVFIDAMGTGFSRIAGKGTEKDFYGVDGDADAFAQFITTWLSRNGRWNSPKFIIGESYGTFRAAVVANILQQRGVHLNGLNLLSMVLDLSTITFGAGDDRSYIFYLPSYAAVAWYHKALPTQPASLEKWAGRGAPICRHRLRGGTDEGISTHGG